MKKSNQKGTDSDLTGESFRLYLNFVDQIKKKFSLEELPAKWLINLSGVLQEVDESLLGKLVLRITNEQESINEKSTGAYVGDHLTKDDFYFIWIQLLK